MKEYCYNTIHHRNNTHFLEDIVVLQNCRCPRPPRPCPCPCPFRLTVLCVGCLRWLLALALGVGCVGLWVGAWRWLGPWRGRLLESVVALVLMA
jgi:hypothetical protein